MGQLGELLRTTREGKGLSLQQVEEETNMRWKYIEALELENYDVIPGKAYVKGFLRNYAAFLELDPEEILEQYQNTYEKARVVVAPEEVAPRSKRKSARRKQNNSRLALTGFLVLVVVALVWGSSVLLSNRSNSGAQSGAKQPESTGKPPVSTGTTNQPKAAEPAKQAPAQQTTPAPNRTQTQPVKPVPGAGTVQYAPVDITLKAAGGHCWLNVVSDGAQVFQGTLNDGQTLNFKGNQTIAVRFGNAGVVQVLKNGTALGPVGGKGMVVNKVFTK